MDFIKQYKMCLKKDKYFSEKEINSALKDNEKKYKKKFRFYKCPVCKCWHLTTTGVRKTKTKIKIIINKNKCFGKFCYKTEKEARQSKEFKRNTYFCSLCKSYHNTILFKEEIELNKIVLVNG